MINLSINETDYGGYLENGSLTIRRYGALRSSFRATLHITELIYPVPEAGQEVQIFENGNYVWGGILVETEQICHSTKCATIHLRGQGYEHLLQRYCLPGFTLAPQTPSDAMDTVFYNYFDSQDLLTLGPREPGIAVAKTYSFPPMKASAVYDQLAAENGFVWWVDEGKTIYIQPDIPQNEPPFCIDLTQNAANRLKDLQSLEYRTSTANYKNMVYIYNPENGVEAPVYSNDLQKQMMGKYGSAWYGMGIKNTTVQSWNDAVTVGNQILATSPGFGEIRFSTDEKGFELGQILDVKAPVCGMITKKTYCITEIRAVYFSDRFRYTVTARESFDGTLAVKSWEALLAAGKSN